MLLSSFDENVIVKVQSTLSSTVLLVLVIAGDPNVKASGSILGVAVIEEETPSIKYKPPESPLFIVNESVEANGLLIHPIFCMKFFLRQILIVDPPVHDLPDPEVQ